MKILPEFATDRMLDEGTILARAMLDSAANLDIGLIYQAMYHAAAKVDVKPVAVVINNHRECAPAIMNLSAINFLPLGVHNLFVVPNPHTQILHLALNALLYHTQQIRPILQTEEVIAAIRAVIGDNMSAGRYTGSIVLPDTHRMSGYSCGKIENNGGKNEHSDDI